MLLVMLLQDEGTLSSKRKWGGTQEIEAEDGRTEEKISTENDPN